MRYILIVIVMAFINPAFGKGCSLGDKAETYEQGLKALKNKNWDEASRLFGEVSAATSSGDAAFWTAYAFAHAENPEETSRYATIARNRMDCLEPGPQAHIDELLSWSKEALRPDPIAYRIKITMDTGNGETPMPRREAERRYSDMVESCKRSGALETVLGRNSSNENERKCLNRANQWWANWQEENRDPCGLEWATNPEAANDALNCILNGTWRPKVPEISLQ